MHIEIKDLAHVKNAALDLKKLTVIIGQNNSGKTYVAYAIYALLKTISEPGPLEQLTSKVFEKRKDSSIRCNLDALSKAYLTYIKRRLKKANSELSVAFQDSSHELFVNAKISLVLNQVEVRDAINIIFDTPVSRLTGLALTRKGNVGYIKRNENHAWSKTPIALEKHSSIEIFLWLLVSLNLFNPFCLPAERSFFLTSFGAFIGENYKRLLDIQSALVSSSRYLDALIRTSNPVRYPKPVEDYLDFLYQIHSNRGKLKSIHPADGQLSALIIKYLQGEHFVVEESEAGYDLKRLRLQIRKNLRIDLHNASSSIKQIAPFLLYLKHSVFPGGLLVIDEPELNLHPENQAKFLEILTMLANQNVPVLITTHSPYILTHLNNLTQDISESRKKNLAKKLYLKSKDAFISQKHVSAYELKEGKLVNLKDETGIRWDSISSVSSDLFEISSVLN